MNTLDDPSAAGRFRRADEEIVISDRLDGTVLHTPPPADSLDLRMAAMCRFANDADTTQGRFIHPAIRSIMLHFWLAYDHPFVDGNGRTARALFYWSMLRHGYWLVEFMSISNIILRGPSKYARAFLYTETDENDLTYFLIYHIKVIRRAIQTMNAYLARKAEEIRRTEAELRGIELLNHRQRGLIRHAVRHPGKWYSVAEHQRANNVSYETARSDLLDLAKRQLLVSHRQGKKWLFLPPTDLVQRLGRLSVLRVASA